MKKLLLIFACISITAFGMEIANPEIKKVAYPFGDEYQKQIDLHDSRLVRRYNKTGIYKILLQKKRTRVCSLVEDVDHTTYTQADAHKEFEDLEKLYNEQQ